MVGYVIMTLFYLIQASFLVWFKLALDEPLNTFTNNMDYFYLQVQQEFEYHVCAFKAKLGFPVETWLFI